MVSTLLDIEQLSISERIQLAEDIWDSIIAAPEQLTVTDEQRQELDRRVEAYHQNPQEGTTWQEVQARIKNRA
jgi:putative addiction module component (TIGR02574 family)